MVQLDEQRRNVLLRGHGLAKPAEAGVERRELHLRLRELGLLLLGLRERLLRRGKILVELAEVVALGRKREEPIGGEHGDDARDDHDVAVTLCHGVAPLLPPAEEEALFAVETAPCALAAF